MAEFNRATLRKVFEDAGMEIPPKDVLGQICDLHTAKTDEMKDTVKELTKRAEKAEQERDALEAQGDDGYKEKFEKEHSDFEKFKAEIAAEKAQASKEKAYREVLKDANLSEKGTEKAIKYADWSKLELDEKGGLKNAAELVKEAKEEWSEYVSNSVIHNAPVPNPPINTGGTAKTKEQIMAIKDGTARRKAIAENLSLFGANPSNSNE